MSATTPANQPATALTFRRFTEGDKSYDSLQQQIFSASHSSKCPTYQQSTPPCQGSCPSGEDIRGYMSIVRGIEKPPAGLSWQEYAFRRLTDANPFPSVMGRVCPAPCESGCNRNEVDDHVGINSVEHFLGDYAIQQGFKFEKPTLRTGKKVAIIGAGPAGLSCAYQLLRKGHACTVFDEHEHPGGMLRYGIPGFRTPREILDAEIQRIVDMGLEVRQNTRVGRDVTLDQLQKDFDAVFVGLGAQSGRPLPVPGSDAPNVVTAMAFLRAFNDGRMRHVGKRVVVIGGGDVSIDVATVAKRLGHIERARDKDRPEHVISGQVAHDVAEISAKQGADVILTSVMSREKMEAQKHEVEMALAEGIELRPATAPIEVIKGADGRAHTVRFAQCDAAIKNGRLEITLRPGTEHEVQCDLVVSAIGQAVDFSGLESLDSGRGLIAADRNYQVQGKPGFFTGGDVVRPHLITSAVGHGAIAAEGIDTFLSGHDLERRPKIDVHAFDMLRKLAERGVATVELKREPLRGTADMKGVVHNFENRSARHIIPHEALYLGHFIYTPRHKRKTLTLTADQVLGHFQERLEALSEGQVAAESKRCMSCGMCFECDNCVIFCPVKAVQKVPKAEATLGRYVYTDYTRCIGCHICHDVCPTGYIQMGLGE
jgi:NADPH-dependent glutamate synthase beta subunit-like oxidoreductase/Pyruvate/2-oxoacid:ferredoxin oxidoreductase delta subunit